MDIDKQAADCVLKARTELILARRFYGVLVSNVEPIISRAVPTAATNGKQHLFNPDYIMRLSPRQRLGLQAHESEHDARHHGTRRGNRDSLKWNEACDYAINIDLIDQGFVLPDNILLDERFRGMSAEDIYRTRELDAKKEEADKDPGQPPPQEDGDADKDPPASKDEGESDESDEDDAQSDDADEGDDNASDESDEAGDDAGGGDNADSDPCDGEAESDTESDGEGETGSGQSDDGERASDAPSGSGTSSEEGESSETPVVVCGDVGGCGEVLDSAEDAADAAEQDQKWERIVRQAASMARAVGQLPGHVSRDIERANNPPQDWRDVLRAWFDQGSLQSETWNRPNRRFAASGLYLPGKQRDGLNRVCFLIDTSGSMDAIALALIKNETQAALDDGVIDEVVVVYGDTRVTRTDTYRTGDEMEFDPRGGGGTILAPLFEHVETEVDDPSLIVCFSDMENDHWGPEPSCPVLFAATGYPDNVRRYLANAPWNAPGIDVGAH